MSGTACQSWFKLMHQGYTEEHIGLSIAAERERRKQLCGKEQV
jgi:hypothetical protein